MISDFPLTAIDLLLAISVVTIGSVIQGSVGFGLGPLAVPLLVLLDPIFVPGPLILAALLLEKFGKVEALPKKALYPVRF